MRKIMWTFLFLAATVSCGKESEKPAGDDPSANDGELAELQTAETYAEAEVAIERLRKQRPGPDWAAIKEKVRAVMPVVKEIDRKHGGNYEDKIDRALDACTRGERPDVHQQTIAKGLQHVAVLAIGGELDALASGEGAARKAAAEKIAAFFEGIRPTFTRRDQDFFPETKTLEKTADAAIGEIRKASESGEGLFGARRSLQNAVAHTYALSVLYEIQEIERLRAADRDACDVKKMEAVIFYRIIQKRVRQRDPEADKTISAMLEADYDKMDAALLEEALRKGLPNIAWK